jgi:urea transporter
MKPATATEQAWPDIVRAELAVLARAYATMLFCSTPAVGIAFAVATFVVPSVGAAGLLGIVTAHLAGRALRFPQTGVHLYNALLVGLGLGFSYSLDFYLAALIVVAAAFSTFAAQALASWAWRVGKLPVLSVPFVLTVWLIAPALPVLSQLTPLTHAPASGLLIGPKIDGFLIALGAFLFVPHPIAGLVLFAGVLWSSRVLALMAAAGYAAGAATLHVLGAVTIDPAAFGYNFALCAMALGGVYLMPGFASIIIALIAAALTALLTVAFAEVLTPLGLPLLVTPFLATTLCLLAGFAVRHVNRSPLLNLERPDLPERVCERAIVAAARGSDPQSVPLYPPFYGAWTVAQGFNGPHTHRAPWQYALDLVISESGTTHLGNGTRLEDYYCFGAPVMAPASGTVAALCDDLPDNRPGEVNTAQNWGNHVLIRTAAGGYVMLAHLRRGSVSPALGQWITAGEPLGTCGNSGRSLQPHLHLQAQVAPTLGAPTTAFHLCGVVTSSGYQLAARPVEGEQLRAATPDARLAAALHLPLGSWLRYRFHDGRAETSRELRVELTLLGQFRVISDLGASAAFEENEQVIGFYDRDDAADPFLDLWLLALGLTPLSLAAHAWSDAPAARLLPLPILQHLLVRAASLAATNAKSLYAREWLDGEHAWVQQGEHRVAILRAEAFTARSRAWISPADGVRRLELDISGRCLSARLEEAGILGDEDEPAADASGFAASSARRSQ